MIIHISMWRDKGGGTAVARLLAGQPKTRGTLLFLESDKLNIASPDRQQSSELSLHFLDFLSTQRLVAKFLTEHGQILLHSHGRRAGWHARLCRLRFGRQVRIVHSFHGIASFVGIKKYFSTVTESILSIFTDAVIADGPAELDIFTRSRPLFCRSSRIMPAYNPDHIVKHTFRSVRRIGFAARMDYPKLHGRLIELVAAFNIKYPSNALDLIFCGDGPKRLQLDEYGRRLLGSKYVSLGHIPEVIDFYRQVDAFAQFSLFEGLPVALVEAMASGLPCIATDVIGNRDVLETSEMGLLVPLNNIEKQLLGLERLVFKEAETKSMASFGRDIALTRFSPTEFCEAHSQLYAEVGYVPSIT